MQLPTDRSPLRMVPIADAGAAIFDGAVVIGRAQHTGRRFLILRDGTWVDDALVAHVPLSPAQIAERESRDDAAGATL